MKQSIKQTGYIGEIEGQQKFEYALSCKMIIVVVTVRLMVYEWLVYTK